MTNELARGVNRWKVAALLFGSGLSALIYQTAWLREFRLIFGASTAATAAVIAIFMGGLGIGGLVLGRRADRVANPLAMYSSLELGVAIFSAVTPLLILAVRWAYVEVGGTVALGSFLGTVVRLVLTAIVLGVPTFLMGGTLPAAARSVETRSDLSRRHLALLYGMNTVGAVAGVLVSTFYFLELFGNRETLWFACAVNALVGMTARVMARQIPERAREEEAAILSAEPGEGAAIGPRFVLAAAAVVGFAFLLMEIVWYRMLAPLLGGSTFTFGLILGIALAGIGIGGAAYALLIANRRLSLQDFALTAAFEALCLAFPYALGDRLAVFALLLRPLGALGFEGHVVGWTIVTSIVVLPAAIVAGIQFPVLIALLGRGDEKVGRHVGLAYLWNTVGAIAGSLAGGFGLLPLLTAQGCWELATALLATVACVAAITHAISARDLRAVAPIAVGIASIAMLGALGPTAAWRHSGIGAGRTGKYQATRNGLHDWVNYHRRTKRWQVDGIESSVALSASSGWAFIINGKSDGSARLDAGTQVMAGLMGAVLHPDPRTALVVGLGTGSSAGWLGAVPSMQRVDVVELEPSLVEVARACAPVNHDVLDNPKVHLWFGDAREWVLTARTRYDVIFSEPSNPYRAGIASLFTREFYDATRRRLEPGGLFLQWVQAYEVDSQTVRSIYATIGSVFPNVETWRTEHGDLLLVASMKPVDYDVPALRRRIAREPFRSALADVWRVSDLEGLLARYVAGSRLMRAIRALGPRLNTDDRTPVEFGFARTVGNGQGMSLDTVSREAARLGDERPRVHGGPVDWDLVGERFAESLVVDGKPSQIAGQFDPERSLRIKALLAWAHGDIGAARTDWSEQTGAPTDDTELLLVAESLADSGSDAALPYIEELRKNRPVEADAALARLDWRRRHWPEAAEALERSFTKYRSDPWPLPNLMERTLQVANAVGSESGDSTIASRIHRVLLEPFSVRMLEEDRNATLFSLAKHAGHGLCNDAMRATLERLEPWVPWNEDLLAVRARCYMEWKLPEARRAQEDLDSFMSNQPLPLVTERPPVETGPRVEGEERRPE